MSRRYAQTMSGGHVHLEPGQVWRLRDSRVVQLAEVQGDDINGVEKLSGVSSSGRAVHVGPAGWAGRRTDFEGAELIGPLFRVSFLFPAAGPQDPIAAALETIGAVLHRSGGRIETGTQGEGARMNLSEVEWTVDVVASEREAAKARVVDVLAPHGTVKEGSMKADQIPES